MMEMITMLPSTLAGLRIYSEKKIKGEKGTILFNENTGFPLGGGNDNNLRIKKYEHKK
jgi:hypothetical protein